jgi:tetratricopeptide (TPR) repeat protein
VDLQLLLSQAERRALDNFPSWPDLFELDRLLAQRYLSQHSTLRFRIAYARLLHAIGVSTNNQPFRDESESRLREALQDHPKRQEVMFALGGILAAHGRLDEAEANFRKAFDEEPKVGESQFKLGRFLARYRDLPAQGASLIAEGVRASCPYFGSSMDELSDIAAAFVSLGDKQGLRLLVPVAENLKPTSSPRPYLALASNLEQAGLLAERDQILRLGMKHAPEMRTQAQLILQGQASAATQAR